MSISGLVKYLKFNEDVFGSSKFYDEYFKVKYKLENLYFRQNFSSIQLAKEFSHSDAANFIKILKKFIKLRNHSEAAIIGVKERKRILK